MRNLFGDQIPSDYTSNLPAVVRNPPPFPMQQVQGVTSNPQLQAQLQQWQQMQQTNQLIPPGAQSAINLNNEAGVKYLDSQNNLYDTDSNINYYNLNERFNTYARPVYPNLKQDIVNPDVKRLIKKLVKEARHHWLEHYWGDLAAYIVVEGKNVRIVNSEKEYNREKQNKYNNIRTKEVFLRDELLTKKFLKKVIAKFIESNGVPNTHEDYNKHLRKYVHKQAKRKLIKTVKENL